MFRYLMTSRSIIGACGAATLLFTFLSTAEAQLDTIRIASELDAPIYVTYAPGRPDSLFIVERGGAIKVLNKNTGLVNPTPFLTIPDVNTTGEGALIGLAFHPDFDTNGRFYVNLTTDPATPGTALTTRIREYTVTDLVGNPDVADPTPKEVLSIAQPQAAHNGGWIGFSPNDTNSNLYIMSGDGGGTNDADIGHTPGTGNAQDLTDNLMGKVLRIDVDGDDFAADNTRNYAIPADNPFVGVTGDDEIWAYGLRNPFRASFDRLTGDLYIGDVGQSAREEIDFQPAASTGGENYGWRLREGEIANPTTGIGGPPPPGNVEPIYTYTHGSDTFQGHSVTAGVVYRGPVPELKGDYIFADFGSDNIWSFDPADPVGTVAQINDELTPNDGLINSVVAVGEDTVGNLYLVDITGEIFRVALRGDLNGDGFVGITDLNTVLTHWNQGVVPGGIQGDLDLDGFVGIGDLNVVLGAWNQAVTAGDAAAGDPSGDGFVGIEDLNVVLGNWNAGTPPGDLLIGDVDGDGFVGIEDLNVVLGNWNTGTPPPAGTGSLGNVPEPSAGIIWLLSLALHHRRPSPATARTPRA
jgi:glucose/arabinose dehydrogenase